MELKRAEPLAAKELAARLGLSLNAVRHHLKELEAEGVLEYVREHRSVGAPAFAYRLSAQGQALFPRRYQETLTYILDHVARRDGRAAARRFAMPSGTNATAGPAISTTDAQLLPLSTPIMSPDISASATAGTRRSTRNR